MDAKVDSSFKLAVSDVYSFAEEIASEFEAVSEICGSEELQPVVLRVINILEHLEDLVLKLNSAEKDMRSLKLENELLQCKKHASVEKLDLDIQEVEKTWKNELDHLHLTISKLQEENRMLQRLLDDQIKTQAQKDSNSEQCLINQLRLSIESLSSQLKEKNELFKSHISCIISLKAALEQEKRLSESLKNKVADSEKLISKLWEEKEDLKNEITLQDEIVRKLQCELKEADEQKAYFKEAICFNKNLQTILNEETHSMQLKAEDYLTKLLNDGEKYLTRISDLEEQLHCTRREADEYKQKYQISCNDSRRGFLHGSRKIRQLFRFFLEFVAMDQTVFYF